MAKKIITLWILLLSLTYPVVAYHLPQEKPYISVMSFNIRYNNPDDAPNDWLSRRNWVGELIEFYNPDFLGTQEVLHDQLKDMQERLPAYKFIGVGRDDGKQAGEYSALFYKTSKYDLVRSSTFWLSESPEKAGVIGWDAVCNRVVTWGEFKDKKTGKKFFVFNTHFDHKGVRAREESSKLLLKKVQEIAGNTDVIITGDFNATPESNVYERLTAGDSAVKGLYDIYALASKPYGPEWTFNSFGKTPVAQRKRIDYIFSNKKVNVKKYLSISEQRGDLFPSDHLPIFAEISFN